MRSHEWLLDDAAAFTTAGCSVAGRVMVMHASQLGEPKDGEP